MQHTLQVHESVGCLFARADRVAYQPPGPKRGFLGIDRFEPEAKVMGVSGAVVLTRLCSRFFGLRRPRWFANGQIWSGRRGTRRLPFGRTVSDALRKA